MTQTPRRIRVYAVLKPLQLIHGWMMDHILRLHLSHFSIEPFLCSRGTIFSLGLIETVGKAAKVLQNSSE
jgi:hypothetical protein